MAIKCRGLTRKAKPAFPENRLVYDAQYRGPIHQKTNEGAKLIRPAGKVFGAVNGVQDPKVVCVLPDIFSFLTEDAMIWAVYLEESTHNLLGLQISNCNGRRVHYVTDVGKISEMTSDDVSRCICQAPCQF